MQATLRGIQGRHQKLDADIINRFASGILKYFCSSAIPFRSFRAHFTSEVYFSTLASYVDFYVLSCKKAAYEELDSADYLEVVYPC